MGVALSPLGTWQLTARPGTSPLPFYHCTSSGNTMGSDAKASIQADSPLFPPPQSQQTERPKKQLPTSEQQFVPSLCPPMSLCTSEQKDSRPCHRWHIQGTWMCRAGAPGCLAPTAPCQLLPPTLPAGQIQPWSSWQGPTGLHHSSPSRSKLLALGMVLGLAALCRKRCSTSPLARVGSAPAPVCHGLESGTTTLSHPPQHISH